MNRHYGFFRVRRNQVCPYASGYGGAKCGYRCQGCTTGHRWKPAESICSNHAEEPGTSQLGATLPRESYKDLFGLTTPEGVYNRAEGIRGKLMGQARAAAPELRSRFAGTGGIGLEQGMELQGFNEANRQANEYLSYLMSPEGRGELSRIVLQLANSFPGMDVFGALNQIIQGRDAPPVGASPLDAIAKVVGAVNQMKGA